MLANMASLISPTSVKRPRTAVAASSGTPRRLSASASCARVRGAAVSIRRQISRATASGSAGGSSADSPEPAESGGSVRRPESARPRPPRLLTATTLSWDDLKRRAARRSRRRNIGVQPRPDPELLLDLLLDLVRQVRVLAQVVPG